MTLTKEQIAELQARLRAVVTTTPRTVGEIMREAGITEYSSVTVNKHLVRTPGVEPIITPAEGLRWRLEAKPDRANNFTFFLE